MAVAAGAAVLAGCTGRNGVERVEAKASVLADATEDIHSGRLELTSEHGVGFLVRFEGDEMAMGASASSGGDEKSSDQIDLLGGMRVIDDDVYIEDPTTHRWTHSSQDGGSVAPVALPSWSEMAGALRDTVVRAPGVRAERDGVAVVRYSATLQGTAARDLLGSATSNPVPDLGDAAEAFPPGLSGALDDVTARMGRINDWLVSHTTVEVHGEIDESGHLVRLELDQKTDGHEYPDCKLMAFGAQTSIVMSEINRPQGIIAPAPDKVDDVGAAGMFGDSGDEPAADEPAGDDPAAEDPAAGGDSTGGIPAVPEPATLHTATGDRDVDDVLDYLRRWAERHDVDWHTMAIPGNDEMVALFDRFYAEDLSTMGPELTTARGRWPRGYVVEVVRDATAITGDDPDAVAALPDAELVARFEGEGVTGLPGLAGDLMGDMFEGCPG